MMTDFNFYLEVLPAYENIKFLLIRNDAITKHLSENNVYEAHITEILKRIIKPDMNCIEIGCNIGYHTIMLSKLAEKGVIYAFESKYSRCHQLCGNLFINNCTNVFANNIILGREEAQNVKKLDKLAKFKDIQLIKIDAQGYDFFTLTGAEITITKNKPVILFKYDKEQAALYDVVFKQIYDYLKLLNYEIYNIINHGQSDYIAIHGSDEETIKKLKVLQKSDLQYVGRTHRNVQ